MLTSKARSYLKSIANKLDSSFQIGKGGITPELTEGINQNLESNEIIKITILNNCRQLPRDIANILSERTRSEIVQIIGKKVILYRPSKDKSKIILSKSK